MITRRIVLIRHGKPEIEPGVPSAEWQLSVAGRSAAKSLASNFRDYSFDSIASSPEPKAIGTAETIASELGGLAVESDAGFSEHARRSVGFLPQNDLDARIASLFNNPDRLVFGDETANQAYARFCASLERLLDKGQRDLLVVSHGTILSIYIGCLMNLDPLPFWRALPMPAAIVLEAGTIRLLSAD